MFLRCIGGAGGVTPNYKNIIKDGVLNPMYAMTGLLTQESDHVLITRTDTTANGGEIVGIDFTDLSALNFDGQNVSTGQITIQLDNDQGTRLWLATAGSSRQTAQYDVSAITGVHSLKVTMYGNNGTGKLFNILAT